MATQQNTKKTVTYFPLCLYFLNHLLHYTQRIIFSTLKELMHHRTPLLYFIGTLIFTSQFCQGAKPHTKNTNAVHQSNTVTPISKVSWKLVACGMMTTSIGYLWYYGLSHVETVFCEDRVDPCQFPGTNKQKAQLLMAAGAVMTAAGAASLLECTIGKSKK